ncbi:MAG: hypothetical protein Q9207_006370, partial [Kuettlingeria erythrocarpa]
MPQLLRRKLICFYCNRRSAQDRTTGIRQWQCERCEAVNHLDEDGEITDPPVQEAPNPARYARPLRRSISPASGLHDRSLFCQRCLQNQHIVNQALAEYLPAQDDLRYVEFEKKLPQYRRNMESRFPQVCETCAPAVEDRIRSTGYAAKTDHLRRMMNRTRGAGVTYKSWSWKRLGALMGAFGWSVGLLGQLLWHALGALPGGLTEDGLIDDDGPQSIPACLRYTVSSLQLNQSCNDLWQPWLAYALGFSLLCFWWNPRMQYKLRGGQGRIVGHVEYYKLQLIALATRYLSWKLMAKNSAILTDPQAVRALHAFTLVLQVILTLPSFRAIRIDQRPLVSFQEKYEPLIPARAQQDENTTIQMPLTDFNPPSQSGVEPFPIEKLAPRPYQPAYQPPTPPPEDDDEVSAMEWTPQHKFQQPVTYRAPQTQPVFNEPSPFHGVLPPAPVSWAQRLRNPPNQPAFHKASKEKKENFFGKKSNRVISDAASDVSSVAPSVTDSSMLDFDSPVKFAPPRFFAPADRMETGLESLFSDTFTLGREPSMEEQQNANLTRRPISANPLPRLLTTLLSAASCVAWDYVSAMLPASGNYLRYLSIAVPAIIVVYNVYHKFRLPQAHQN